jgi:hypothetical protein
VADARNATAGPVTPASPEAAIRSVSGVCAAFHIDALTPQLNACIEALHNSGAVDVAVLGQFKAGKSS